MWRKLEQMEEMEVERRPSNLIMAGRKRLRLSPTAVSSPPSSRSGADDDRVQESHVNGRDDQDAISEQDYSDESDHGGHYQSDAEPAEHQRDDRRRRRQEENEDQEEQSDDDEPRQEDGDDRVSASPPPSSSGVRSESAVLGNVTVEDAGALDCGVCFFPLKPPIFQCDVGHVVCSPCRDKLAAAGRCHVCRAPTAGGYRRCHAMEHLVESIRVPCPHAAHGCAARPAYHELAAHRRACPRAPCRCPVEACAFVASVSTLLDHLAATHRWQCPAAAPC